MRQDIIIDSNGDLTLDEFANLVIDNSDDQHVFEMIRSAPGYFKQYPLFGVNIYYYLNSDGKQGELNLEINKQLAADLYSKDSVEINIIDGQPNISINADSLQN
jgi:hypothetical protein